MSPKNFWALARDDPATWQEEDLGELSGKELAALCELLGIPHSGTKERLRERIWRARHLRLVLAPYDTGAAHAQEQAAVEALAANYTATELLALCRAADVYASSTKYGRAAALLQWRNGCRRKGQAAWADFRQAMADRPRQRRLQLE